MKMLGKNYNFVQIEEINHQKWKNLKINQYNPNISREETFVVDTPPPGISGTLHMGHVFSYTQTDFIVRYKRMIGKNIFYPMGFDDNGLPTEKLVEKTKKIKSTSMSRAEFVSLCKEVVPIEEENCRDLFNNLSLSVDWSLEYQTISDQSISISQMSFLDLVEKKQIYRANQPILWDPVDQTALAQTDIIDKERESIMIDIIFKTENGDNIIIATTRPELLPCCAAIFFHPDDSRYINLKGQNAIAPLFNIKVPIMSDMNVDIKKGTGLVMCCTYGDSKDIEWKKAYNLPENVIIDKSGKIITDYEFDERSINQEAAHINFQKISGLYAKDARVKIIELLKELNFIAKETPIIQSVKCAERSGAPLEIISTPQWFVNLLDHKDAMLKKSNELNWYPGSMKIKLEQWINSISWDWCISRQRFFGVPFPVWYSKKLGEKGKPIFASQDQLPVDPLKDLPRGYSKDEVDPDFDVMDTWATSSVSPQLNSHGINDKYFIDKDRHNILFPADLRPQAHEIIRTWTYYTMLKAYFHEGKLPWKDIMISGWCLASDKTKMSKSKGNIVDPVTLLKNHGADIVRYWAASSRLGADTAYSEEVLLNGKRLINKLWNSGNFVLMHINDIIANDKTEDQIFCETDLWILSKLNKLIDSTTQYLDKYEYALAKESIEKFFWNDFCDNYLEIIKVRIYDKDGIDNKGQLSAKLTLYRVYETLLKLFAPYIPHITEALYNNIYDENVSIHANHMWPSYKEIIEDHNHVEDIIKILDLVRKNKADNNLSIKAKIELLEYDFEKNIEIQGNLLNDLKNVINADKIVKSDLKIQDIKYFVEGLKIKVKFESL
jgi:valyl-tRNA synthetase